MVEVTMMGKLNKVIFLNPHQIEYIEADASTTIVMLSGKRLVVQENIPQSLTGLWNIDA
jgi:flagellar protein FlbD